MQEQRYAPLRRVSDFLYSSLSFADIPLSFSSSSRARFTAISLSNLTFHILKDSIVTGVPLVLASSAYEKGQYAPFDLQVRGV